LGQQRTIGKNILKEVVVGLDKIDVKERKKGLIININENMNAQLRRKDYVMD
jgi:hypothetical protein